MHGFDALVVLVTVASAASAMAREPACPGGGFVVDGEPLLDGDEVPSDPAIEIDVIRLDGRLVSTLTGCAPTKAKLRKRGRRLSGRWRECGTARKLRVKAGFPAGDCDRLEGTWRRKGTELRRFTATRSACGDGFVDAAIGEVCDDGNRRGCDGCAGDCRATLEECVAAYDCTGYQRPALPEPGACPDPSAPDVLGGCGAGSGNVGRWVVDADGLPAYDFLVDQRCDAAAAPYTPRAMPLRDPIHAVGNGRGLMAMAHASGAVELYTQDLGHKWVNRVDTWRDPENPSFPPQLGGGFNYYAVLRPGEEPVIGSTRFEDLPVGAATTMQSRRFGVGYFETVSGRDRTRSTGRTPHAPAKRTHTSPRR